MKALTLFSTICLVAVAAKSQTNVGIGTTTPKNKLEVVSTVTSPTAATIYGTNTSTVGSAIYGVSNAVGTTGAQGTSNFGIGVYGSSTSFTAVGAGAISGIAVYASSVSGIGLSVLGKLRLSGGDTNPSDGAVLTSDANGNAVWKPRQIGFFAKGVANAPVPISTFKKVEFYNEDFDLQNNFVPTPSAVAASTSVFTAPIAGIYHFSSAVLFQHSTDIESGQIRLIKNISSTVLANYEADVGVISSNDHFISLEIQGDFYLNANDKVWVEVAQRNIIGSAISLNISPAYGRFSGHLKIPD